MDLYSNKRHKILDPLAWPSLPNGLVFTDDLKAVKQREQNKFATSYWDKLLLCGIWSINSFAHSYAFKIWVTMGMKFRQSILIQSSIFVV